MVNRILLRQHEATTQEWDSAVGNCGQGFWEEILEGPAGWESFEAGNIYPGRVSFIDKEWVIVDIGYKSEGYIPHSEWDSPPHPEQIVSVLLEDIDVEDGQLHLSKRRAERIEAQRRVLEKVHEGETVQGTVTRRTKGGLLVDIGIEAFLPGSQVDLRRPPNLEKMVGKEIECQVISIDHRRPAIVLSRRALLEAERRAGRQRLFQELQVGDVRRGKVSNVVSFGAFVDLGGLDGLLHKSDMRWRRVGDPAEVVSVGDQLEVMVLDFDAEKERVSLGLKQLEPDPWSLLADQYRPGDLIQGRVQNLAGFGAFVEVAPGVSGLLHNSDMSWLRKITHPSEMISVGDDLKCVILEIQPKKQRLALGMKQLQDDPWDKEIPARYHPEDVVEGTVTKLTGFGAFVLLEEQLEGLLHVSELPRDRQLSDLLEVGQPVQVRVIQVEPEKRRIRLSMRDAHGEAVTSAPQDLRGGLGSSGPLIP